MQCSKRRKQFHFLGAALDRAMELLVPLENVAAVIATSWRSFADSLTLAFIGKASAAVPSSSTITASKKTD